LVSDCSRRGIQAAGRIRRLVDELKLNVPQIYLIVNRVPNGKLNVGLIEEIEKQKLDLIGIVPVDSMIYEYDANGKPLANLPEDSVAKLAISEILLKLNL
jgi:CO dehydrogenase maturation factor